jgi:hypothetical protein
MRKYFNLENFKWLATALIITSAVVAAAGYHPYNFLWSSIGSVCWTVVGIVTHDKPLLTLNAFMTALQLMAYFTNGGTL